MHAAHTAPESPAASGRIGPNSLIQTVGALRDLRGSAETQAVLSAIGREDLLVTQPGTMIDEAEFIALVRAVRGQLEPAAAAAVMVEAGARTANYILGNRIPAPARTVLRLLPAPLALRALLPAIAQHAWTFAGTAQFSYNIGRTTTLRLKGCAECRGEHRDGPICHYYRGAFEGLLRALVSKRAQVRQTACAAAGSEFCEFVVRW